MSSTLFCSREAKSIASKSRLSRLRIAVRLELREMGKPQCHLASAKEIFNVKGASGIKLKWNSIFLLEIKIPETKSAIAVKPGLRSAEYDLGLSGMKSCN